MTNFDQVPFDASEFVDNPRPCCPCLLLLDASTSTAGERIDELNAGLDTFALLLPKRWAKPGRGQRGRITAEGVEVAVLSFVPVRLQTDFTTADNFTATVLRANGAPPMGEAISTGLALIEQRKQLYRQ